MKIITKYRKIKTYKTRKLKRVNPEKVKRELLYYRDAENRIIPWYTAAGEFFGLLWCHVPYDSDLVDQDDQNQCGDKALHCEAMLSLEPGDHRLAAVEPMTIFPSLVCTICDKHGVLFKGKYKECIHSFSVLPQGD